MAGFQARKKGREGRELRRTPISGGLGSTTNSGSCSKAPIHKAQGRRRCSNVHATAGGLEVGTLRGTADIIEHLIENLSFDLAMLLRCHTSLHVMASRPYHRAVHESQRHAASETHTPWQGTGSQRGSRLHGRDEGHVTTKQMRAACMGASRTTITVGQAPGCTETPNL